MTRRPPLPALLLALTLVPALILGLTGCVTVPSRGGIERIEGQPPACTNCLSVEVNPPRPGDAPGQIVEGFLRATSNFQPDYAVARQFLTPEAAGAWNPEAGVAIYTGTPSVNGNQVVLNGQLVGRLGADRSFTPQDRALQHDFRVVKVGAGWRISAPPAGLLVAEYAFETFYQSYNLYFVGNGRTLVPDPIYLPNLRNSAGLATVLVRSLLGGPTAWLRPGVTTAVPLGTTLDGDAVTVADGTATIPLSAQVEQLDDAQRRLLTAQVVSTVQPLGVRGVRFLVGGRPFPVPGADPATQVVPSDTVFPGLNPVPTVTSDQLYAVRQRGVETVDATAADPTGTPLPGPLGTGRFAVTSLAVSVDDTELAVVTDGGTVLRRATTRGSNPVTVLDGVTRLLRPQFTRYGELWAVGDQGGRQRLWVFDGDRRQEVDLAALGPGRIESFAVSPDGSRIALVRGGSDRAVLGLAVVVRAARTLLTGWRPLLLSRANTPDISLLRSVGWTDATGLAVLGGSSPTAPFTPYRISQDGFDIAPDGDTTVSDAVELTVSLRTQTGIIVDRAGRSWRDAGVRWVPFLDGVRTVAYPG